MLEGADFEMKRQVNGSRRLAGGRQILPTDLGFSIHDGFNLHFHINSSDVYCSPENREP